MCPGLRSAYDKIRIRRSIEYPVAGVAVALRRDGKKLADLRVAFTGTNPRPVFLDGTAELCGGPLDEKVLKKLDDLDSRPGDGDEDDVHARPLSPPRRQACSHAGWSCDCSGTERGRKTRRFAVAPAEGGGALTEEFSRRRPYNAASEFIDANVARGLGTRSHSRMANAR